MSSVRCYSCQPRLTGASIRDPNLPSFSAAALCDVILAHVALVHPHPNPTTNPNFRQLQMAKEILYRSSTIERKDNIDEEARTIELSFSSEAPVERVFGNEVLEHSTDAAAGPPTGKPIR